MTQSDIYKKVADDIKNRCLQNKIDRDGRLEEIYEKIPQIKEIDEKTQEIGSSAALEIISDPENSKQIKKDLIESMDMLGKLRAETLKSYGYDASYTDMHYDCDKCMDTGYVNGKECECLKNRIIREKYKKSTLCNLFETQGFENFDLSLFSDTKDKSAGISQKEAMAEAQAVCKHFVRDFDTASDSLFFYGGVGLGKTFLSTCIAKELIAKGYTVIYQSSAKLFSYYLDYLFGREDASQAKDEIDKLTECDLLIIDDLGAEATNSQTVSFLFEIVNDRILMGKKMVISTNYSISEMAKFYSERLHSRIMEHFIPVRFFGDDVRIKKMLK